MDVFAAVFAAASTAVDDFVAVFIEAFVIEAFVDALVANAFVAGLAAVLAAALDFSCTLPDPSRARLGAARAPVNTSPTTWSSSTERDKRLDRVK